MASRMLSSTPLAFSSLGPALQSASIGHLRAQPKPSGRSYGSSGSVAAALATGLICRQASRARRSARANASTTVPLAQFPKVCEDWKTCCQLLVVFRIRPLKGYSLLQGSFSKATEVLSKAEKLQVPGFLVNNVDIFIFDCDGVIWRGDSIIPGIPQVAVVVKTHGIPFCSLGDWDWDSLF